MPAHTTPKKVQDSDRPVANLQELMKLMGSRTGSYDPEPPSHWRYWLIHGTAEQRAIAWVKSKTTAYGHRRPFVCDEHGKALTVKHLADELGWLLRSARNVLHSLEAVGFVRVDSLDEGGRIWLLAEVPATPERRTKGELKDSVQSHIPPYLAEKIAKLPKEQRIRIEGKYFAYLTWRNDLFAEGMAALRSIDERYHDTMLAEEGLEKKRLQKRRAAADPAKPAPAVAIQLELLSQPDFVQSPVQKSVQTAENGSYKVPQGSVQTAHPLLGRKEKKDVGGRAGSSVVEEAPTAAKPARPPGSDPDPLRTGLARRGYAHLDQQGIERIRHALGNAPLTDYWRILDERLSRAAKKGESIGQPILVGKAKETRRGHEILQSARYEEETAAAAESRKLTEEAEADPLRQWYLIEKGREPADTKELLEWDAQFHAADKSRGARG